jgi:hypothetical protein
VQNRPAFEEAQPEAARDAALKADWNVLLDQIPHDDAEQSYAALLQHLIQCDTTSIDQEVIFSNLALLQGKRRSAVMAANLMSIPEFQLI